MHLLCARTTQPSLSLPILCALMEALIYQAMLTCKQLKGYHFKSELGWVIFRNIHGKVLV